MARGTQIVLDHSRLLRVSHCANRTDIGLAACEASLLEQEFEEKRAHFSNFLRETLWATRCACEDGHASSRCAYSWQHAAPRMDFRLTRGK